MGVGDAGLAEEVRVDLIAPLFGRPHLLVEEFAHPAVPPFVDQRRDLGPSFAHAGHRCGAGEVGVVDVLDHRLPTPQHVSVRVLFYRADLLRKHGLSPPSTWEELESQVSYVLLHERDPDLAGLTFEYRPSVRLGVLLDHVWASGEDLYEGDVGSFSLNRKRVVEALVRLRRLVDDGSRTVLPLTPSERMKRW